MPRVWLTIPSKRPVDEANAIFREWHGFGAGVAVFIDKGDPIPSEADIAITGDYGGYPRAANTLCRYVINHDPGVVACICAGDDIHPCKTHTADQLADEFADRFPDGYGVMSPVGDGFEANNCCLISPWFGHGYIKRSYRGKGPWCDEYAHYWVDAEGFDVAKMQGVLWVREDVAQHHDHWTRTPGASPPAFLEKWRALNQQGLKLYQARKAAGFPGHKPR